VWNDEPGIGEKQGEIFSIDYLIGEPGYLRRGYGKEKLAQMLEMLRKTGAKTVIVEPERDNTASNHALEANGFMWSGHDYHLEL
jgi:predicted acetyltransferase